MEQTIANKAKTYEAGTIGNITELEKVSIACVVSEKTFKEGTADEFRLNVINVDGNDYRIPASVLASLKPILEEKPELKFFKVRKEGTGMNTKYTVITVD